MKKGRIVKIVSVVLVTVVLFQLLAVCAFAYSEDEVNSRNSYLAIKAEVVAEVRSRPTVTDGVAEISQRVILSWVESALESLRDDYGYDSADFQGKIDVIKLANIFATQYDCQHITSILIAAYIADDNASSLYPNSRWMQDAYRHVTWNFRGAKAAGEENMRIYSTSYEWSNVLNSDWKNYYQERFNYYTNNSNGYTADQIEEMAQNDATDFACELRYALQSAVANQKWKFNQAFCFVEKDNSGNIVDYYYSSIMDFYNNRTGCEYAESNPSYSDSQMFNAAVSSGKVVTFAPTLSAISSYGSSIFLTGWWELF